jgi:hypothetical protein
VISRIDKKRGKEMTNLYIYICFSEIIECRKRWEKGDRSEEKRE